jgi:D-serine deaminase-like pyridoxal phosphate-dependent protein
MITKDALITPALLLNLPAARRNIHRMATQLTGKAQLRPHVKAHKCPLIARMQSEWGAIGFTTATVWEAVALANYGLDSFLVANEIVGPEKIHALARLARTSEVLTAVDDRDNAAELSAAAQASGSEIGVLIDVDTGMNRCGVRTPEAAVSLAAWIADLPGLHLRGVTGYEGHCALETDRTRRTDRARTAMDFLVETVDALTTAGHKIEIISAGGTGTYDLTGLDPRITEIQAGSYVFMDATRLPIAPAFETSLTVLCTVVSRQETTVVVDGGRKTVGVEFNLPRLLYHEAAPRAAAEEHLLFEVPPDSTLRVGDRVEILPGYAPTTVNLHAFYHVLEGDAVMDRWPILARGAGTEGVR